ncbi:MAG: sigma-54-dependent Fis family transcriptional regulator [Myxococcales bacterium]|nr:sigma-54-dependent Fis family transcriptional regulator [Myxococcales bacterium]MCB9650541.1 sigma-54-dependent Fis family transcriptional regulator [Deltaproteobacteria bacterium]
MASPVPEGQDLSGLASALRGAEDFERAGVVGLGHLIEVADAALQASRFTGGRMLRATLHLRPKDGYAGLFVLERGADALTHPGEVQAILPSATVWRWIEAGRVPVAVDVEMGLITPRSAEPQVVNFSHGAAEDEAMSDGSRLRLLQHGATHIYVLPLLVPGGLAGMISLEAECPAAMGTEFIWGACEISLEAAAWLAGPYLAGLPLRVTAEGFARDALLPVVGPTMAPVVNVFKAFAAEEETLLMRGETGSGKSRLARWCHSQSPRKAGPFEILDLHTVPEETQMGELFGWRKGAFTGAVQDHAGYVARADGGTLFIDEVDKLSLKAQAALLFLLEERRYRVLGDQGEPRRANVRFMVGTNADLKAAVAEGRFREDLYYRINVLPLALPPLRERLDEVADWALFMLERRHRERGGVGPISMSKEAQAALLLRTWPGNLRQLDNMMRRAYTLASLERRGEGVRVEARHLDMAEGLEGGARDRPRTPLSVLREAATQLVTTLMSADPPLDLTQVDLPGALHGAVLAEAVRLTGDREAAFRLLGREELVKNRNHHKALRRDWGRLAALAAVLGEDLPEGPDGPLDA